MASSLHTNLSYNRIYKKKKNLSSVYFKILLEMKSKTKFSL